MEFSTNTRRLVVSLAVVALVVTVWANRPRPVSPQADGQRGRLLDRTGRVLAQNVEHPSVWFDPVAIGDPDAALEALCLVVDGCAVDERDHLYRRLRDARRYVPLRRRASAEQVARVRALRLPGVHVGAEIRRWYRYGDVGSAIVGYAGPWVGSRSGAEWAFDKDLRPRGTTDGADVQLTIDIAAQARLEEYLDLLAAEVHATAVVAVALEPSTGEVVALPQWPRAERRADSFESAAHLRVRAVTDIVEAGTLVEPLLVAEAMVSAGYSDRPHAADRAAAPPALAALQTLGLDWGKTTLESFGLGARPALRFGAETAGWTGGEPPRFRQPPSLRRFARGQLTGASLIQLASAYGALVQGARVGPAILRSITTAAGTRASDVSTRSHYVAPFEMLASDIDTRIAGEPRVPGVLFVRDTLHARVDQDGVASAVAVGAIEVSGRRWVMVVQADVPAPGRAASRAVRQSLAAMLGVVGATGAE